MDAWGIFLLWFLALLPMSHTLVSSATNGLKTARNNRLPECLLSYAHKALTPHGFFHFYSFRFPAFNNQACTCCSDRSSCSCSLCTWNTAHCQKLPLPPAYREGTLTPLGHGSQEICRKSLVFSLHTDPSGDQTP